MAQVYKRTHYGREKKVDTVWWIRWRDAEGKDRRQRIGNSKRQAQEVLALRLAEAVEGTKLPPKRDGAKLFSEFADEYFEVHGSKLAWERTVSFIIEHWRKHLGKGCRLKDITVRKIEAFRSKRLAKGVSTATVNRNVAVLKRMLNVAVDWDLIQENPAKRIKQYREEGARMRFLSKEEAERLLGECRASRNELLEPLVVLALNTGARKGELVGLRWADVSLDARTISFPRTKNGDRRDLPINDAAVRALHGLRKATREAEHVFSRDGVQVTEYRTAWEAAVERAGLEDFRFHDIRHTMASWATQAGMDVRKLQRLLGHKTLAMTMRYSHLAPSDLREAVELVSIGG